MKNGQLHIRKEGKRVHKVADLSEFWRGQKQIKLLDQNPTACKEWRDMGYMPYIMIYNKRATKKGSDLRKLQRWVNSKVAFMACKRFEDFI